MNNFSVTNGVLHAEALPLPELAEQYGTPLYIYSRAHIEERFRAYQEPLSNRDHLICYAVKANSNIAVLKVLSDIGAGFDIVSRGELERVLAAGGDPAKIVFSGVAKTAEDMSRALEVGIHCFNVESIAELERLNSVALQLNKVANISLRVNPDVDAKTHPYISTGLKDNKFGIAIDQAVPTYQKAASMKGVNIAGVDCHIGSQLTSVAPFADALDRLLTLIDRLEALGITFEHIDIGGGLGVQYDDETPPSPQEYLKVVLDKLAGRKLSLLLEPGRSIVANAGVLLTRVEYLKGAPEKKFAIVDAAMNDLLRPALYQAWMKITAVVEDKGLPVEIYDVVGPVCESGDFLGKERKLALTEGSLLAVHSAGAYGFTMSSNYNTRNRAAEVMVDGTKAHLIRQRETVEYQLQLEKLID